jgi:hypothetical protein
MLINTSSDIVCPFCNEKDFDLIGLKHHLEMGRCYIYNNVISLQEEQRLRENKNE